MKGIMNENIVPSPQVSSSSLLSLLTPICSPLSLPQNSPILHHWLGITIHCWTIILPAVPASEKCRHRRLRVVRDTTVAYSQLQSIIPN